LEANKEGQSCLLSCGAPDSHCRRSGVDLLPFLAHLTVAAPGQLAYRTLSGAHRTLRCPLPTVGAGHASPADCAADRWLIGQSDAPPDRPVNYSRTPPIFPESGLFTSFLFFSVSSTYTNTLVYKNKCSKSRNIPHVLICTFSIFGTFRT
jgi:hypothetical protein